MARTLPSPPPRLRKLGLVQRRLEIGRALDFLTKLHLIADAEIVMSERVVRIACHSPGSQSLSVIRYAVSTPSAVTFLMTVPMLPKSVGCAMTAMRFLHR